MAFNSLMQMNVARIADQFQPGSSVVEWGNQRFKYNPGLIDYINKEYGWNVRKPIQYVWDFFEDLNFSEYIAIDINTELKAVAMDLNFILADKYNYFEQFDLVTNNGTGEHIFDQRTVFENMHNLCKVGGIMLNVLPMSPWLNHGFYNYNPNLFRDVVLANGYEWVLFSMGRNAADAIVDFPTDNDSWAFYDQSPPKKPYSRLESALESLQTNDNIFQNASLCAAYRKTVDRSFIVPMQGRYVNDMVTGIKEQYNPSNVDVRQSDHRSAT